MGKNLNRRFTISLDIDSKNVEKQVKSTVGNLKTILADLGNASDKMNYFKELIDYMQQVDTAVDTWRKNNAFGNMFDGLDENLRKEMENVFGVAKEELSKLSALKDKVLNAKTNGATTDELKAIEQEIKSLYGLMGREGDAKISGRGAFETRIEKMEDALNNFAIVWKNVNDKISKGLGFGGSSDGSFGGDSGGKGDPVTSSVQGIINKLNRQNEELKSVKKQLDSTLKDFNKTGSVSDKYKIDITEESVRGLMSEYDNLEASLQSADRSSAEYYNTLTKLIEVSLRLKKAFQEVQSNDELNQLFINAQGGRGNSTLRGELSAYANIKSPISKDVQKTLDGHVVDKTIQGNNALIEELKNSGDINAIIQKRVDLYSKLKSKLVEYQKESQKTFDSDEDEDESWDKLESIEKEIQKISGTKGKIDSINMVLSELADQGSVVDTVLKQLYKTLGMELPDDFKNRIEEIASQVDILNDIEQTGNTGPRGGKGTGTGSGAGMGDGSGQAGGTGTGISGGTVDVSSASLENVIKSEAATIANKLNDVLKVELVKDDTKDVQSIITGIKSTVDEISGAIDAYKQANQVDEQQAEINAMKQNLLQLLDVTNKHNSQRDSSGDYQSQELSASIMSDGSISVGFGEKGSVPWGKIAESMLSNLSKGLLADIHTHPLHELLSGITFVSDSFSGSSGDLGAFGFSKKLGAQVAGMLTGNILKTINLSSLTPNIMRDFRTQLQEVESEYTSSGKYDRYIGERNGKRYAKLQKNISDQHKVTEIFESMMYDAFDRVGLSREQVDRDIFKQYNLTDDVQLTELASHLVALKSGAEVAISPMDRLVEIIQKFGGSTTGIQAEAFLKAFDKGEMSASDVFNQLIGSRAFATNNESLNKLFNIDSTNITSSVDTALTTISNILSSINSSVGAIESNMTKDVNTQIGNMLNDIGELKSGALRKDLLNGIDSIYDPNNVTRYKYNDVKSKAEESLTTFLQHMGSVELGYYDTGSLLQDTQVLISEFKTAYRYIDDLESQTNLYATDSGRDPYTDEILDTASHKLRESLLEAETSLAPFVEILKRAKIELEANVVDDKFTNEPSKTNAEHIDSGITEHLSLIVGNLSSISATLEGVYGLLSGANIQAESTNTVSSEQLIQSIGALNESIRTLQDSIKNISTGNDTGSAGKGKQSSFNELQKNQAHTFNEYRKNVSDADYMTEELRQKIDGLGVSLREVSDESGLEKWKQKFTEVKEEVSILQSTFEKEGAENLKKFHGTLNSELKGLFDTTTQNPTAEQQEILDLRRQLIQQLEVYEIAIKNGKNAELDSIHATISALKEKVSAYRAANDLVNSGGKSGKTFGATATINATAKFNSLKQQVTGVGSEFANSEIVKNAFKEYEAAYNRLIAKRKEMAQLDNLNDSQIAGFKQLQTECNNYAKILNKIITDSQKLNANAANDQPWMLGGDFEDTAEGRKAALTDFVQEMYGVSVAAEDFKNNWNEVVFAVDNGDGTFTQMSATFNAAKTQIVALAGDTKKATGAFEAFFNELKGKFKSISAYLISSFSIQEVWQQVRKGVTYVKEIDSALTELKKVTDETEESYKRVLSTASQTAQGIGSTVSDFVNATADFARLGYDVEQASELAKAASVYKNVGDGIDDIATASESIISTMKAYGIEAENTMGIVDRFNEVGNNFAISSTGIGEAMKRSASALFTGGNSIDESIGLITAANSVIQDPAQVGTALKTLTLRLRGAKVELEEAGLDAEDMVETTSQLQEKLKALTHGKVDIMIDEDSFKNTTQILREMSYAWQDMTDIERASALELMGGKRQANILSSLITNFETVEDVIETSSNSSGSALKENEKYLDSIQGKMDQFTNTLQTFWMKTISSDMVKGIVDLGTGALDLVNTIGLIPTALAGVLFYFTAIKKNNPVTMFKELFSNIHNYGQALNQIKSIQSLNGANGTNRMDTEAFNDQHIKAYGIAVQGLTQKQQVAALATAGLTKEQIAQAIGVRDLTDANFQAALAEAQVTNAKNKNIATSGALILANQKDLNTKLYKTSQNFLLKHSEEEITEAMLDQAVAAGEISKRTRNNILLAQQQTQANMQQSASWKGLATSIGNVIKQNPVMFFTAIATILSGLISKIETATDRTQKLSESYNELQSSISSIEGEIDSLDSELGTIQERMDELNSKDSLSLTDAEQLNLLKQQATELKRQKDVQEQLLAAREDQNQVKSLSMVNNLIKTTAANQEKTAESGKKLGSALMGVAGAITAVIGAAAIVGSGGTASALGAGLIKMGATGIIGAATGGATLGSAIGSKIGEAAGGMHNKSDSLIEWYESYTEAISKAETEASEAETKYLSDVSDKNYEKWQKKVEAVNTLQTEMYDGLEEMQGYISNLEYNDQTKEMIDSYNNLMAHISVTSMDGDVNAQISSIEALKSEYESLSRGVDEHGNNIALTAEEYARYQAIVSQVIGCNVGLTQTFDENGGAIKDASGNLVSYNSILTKTIELLKQQQQEAAKTAIEGEDGDNKPLWKAYKNAKKNYDAQRPDRPSNRLSTKEMGELLGVDYNEWQNDEDFIRENIDLVQENLDKMVQEASTRQYNAVNAEEYRKYLESLISHFNSDVLSNQFKETLSIIPQISDAYDQLSGSQLSFINEYISSLEVTGDMSKNQITQIKDDILDLVNTIGDSPAMQEAVDELMTLDESSTPVGAYKQKFDQIWEEIFPDENTQALKDANPLYKQLLPDQKNIDKMMTDVKDKVDASSRHLVQGLSQEELKVAFKLIPDIQDGITMEELKQKIKENSSEITGPIVETYSALMTQAESFNEIEKQTSEIILDNTRVTQEYKDSLIELGITEEELSDYFDDTNKLVVTNAKGLNNLIKNTKSNVAQNAKLAKSQARLQYYELYKKMREYVGVEGEVVQAKVKDIIALYEEMNALEKTIAQYSRLEVELLGAANAYKKFEQAQEMDAQSDYITSAEGMIQALGEAFNTAELGTETAQAAIAGLVPESVFKDLDTVDQKMAAIHKYFKEGKLAQYFDIQFDDDGAIESVEMKLGNLRKFIEDGLHLDENKDGIKVFEGADWQHFEFSNKFLAGLDSAKDKLQYFADQMGVTKEVAFAFIESINDHDIEWLNGDYSSMFDSLTQSLEGDIFKTTQAIADLNVQLATGKIGVKEYRDAMYGEDGLAAQEEKLADQAREQAKSWLDKSEALEAAKEKLDEYYDMLESGKDKEGNVIDAEKVKDDIKSVSKEVETLVGELVDLEEPTELTLQVAIDDIQKDIDKAKNELESAKIDLEKAIYVDAEGVYHVSTDFQGNTKLEEYVALLNEQHALEVQMGPETPDVLSTLQSVSTTLDNIRKLLETKYHLELDTSGAYKETTDFKTLWDKISDKSVTLSVVKWVWEKIKSTREAEVNGTANIHGTAYAKGTAHKTGNWGLPTNEHNALVGELGAELIVDPHSGRYYTVGDNGAEMVNLPKGAIIFNHKQTEGLLKNGHITSRGRSYASGSAFAEGNAHVTIYPTGSSKNQWEGTGYSGPDDPTYSLADALSNIKNAKDAADEFADTIDWVEIRLEEINEQLDLMSAKLENAASVSSKNSIIDQMIGVNENKMNNLTAGIKKYSDYAARLLADVPAKYRDAAQNGAISISEFAGEADEKTVEAINNYREWAQKVADLKQQLEETKTEIRDLALQKYDNIQSAGDALATIENSQTEKLQNAVDYDETRGLITDPRYYAAMMENSKYKVTELTKTRNEMQKQFDDMVKSGQLVRWTPQWFEELDKLYQIDAEIDEATIELEEFQNAINDIYWESFDELIDQFDYISDETQGLIDIMSSADMVTKLDNEDGWTEKDVKWTKEGLATLGLHAQEMERAEEKAKMYAKAIDDLTAEYKAGHYSQSEYNEKLNELTQGQYEAIEAAKEEKEAIVELQEARIEEVKKGIEKQIDAYEELIEKQKDSLSNEKDAYDFQKNVQNQQKNMAEIQRKITALSTDSSASAIAKRKQLEAELYEAQAELQDTYYERSVQDRQDALDKELENYKEEKELEMEELEKYLDNVELVVKDSLNIVQANAKEIGQTLTDQTKEYNLTVSSAVLEPWRDGASAIDEYTTKFGDTVSSTTSQLDSIKTKWYEIRTEMAAANAEADKYYQANTNKGQSVSSINKENQNYITAKKEEPKKTTTTTTTTTTNKSNNKTSTQKTIKVGGKINAGSAKIYSSAGAKKGSTQYYAKDPIYVVLEEKNGYLKVRHHKSSKGVTGWFKKSDVKAYAKGSLGVGKNQLAWIDELGEELQMVPGANGRLEYIKKGTGIVPADLTERLMNLAINPQEVLDRNRPEITPSKSVINNTMEIHVDASVGELIHVERIDGNNLDEVTKLVDKAWDKKMQGLNNAIRKYSR